MATLLLDCAKVVVLDIRCRPPRCPAIASHVVQGPGECMLTVAPRWRQLFHAVHTSPLAQQALPCSHGGTPAARRARHALAGSRRCLWRSCSGTRRR